MEVHFPPSLQATLDQLVVDTGQPPDKLVEDAVAAYVAEVVSTRQMLDGRYEDLKTGRVKPVSKAEMLDHFRNKSAAARKIEPGL
jgi:hypothetical protein